MKNIRFLAPILPVAALALTLHASPARAALETGASAPGFTTQASMGGKEFSFVLADALAKGPVVLYFYPAAFTKGCTIEAHDFADAMDEFHGLGATVIGISTDKIETLDRFSVSECRSRFAVAADPEGTVAKSYDVMMPNATHTSRTSFVIAPDGHILMSYSDRAPDAHIEKSLAAIRSWKASQKN